MDVHAFQELQSRVFDLRAQGRFRDALEVAVLAAEKFPEKITKTAYWMACLYSRLGETGKALGILNEAVREGAWWSEAAFLSDPDFEAVRNTGLRSSHPVD